MFSILCHSFLRMPQKIIGTIQAEECEDDNLVDVSKISPLGRPSTVNDFGDRVFVSRFGEGQDSLVGEGGIRQRRWQRSSVVRSGRLRGRR